MYCIITILMNKIFNPLGFIIILIIKLYRIFFSCFSYGCCKYTPTCSEYSIDSIKKHGIFIGGFLSIRRILSCHPFNKKGGHDPVL